MTDLELHKMSLAALSDFDYDKRLAVIDALRERLAQPYCDDCGGTDAECPLLQPEQTVPSHQPEQTHCEKCFWTDPLCSVKQPEQTPLDRMADNARELGLDYESQHTKKYVPEPATLSVMKEGKDFTISKPWVGLTEAEKVNIAISCGCADVAWMTLADSIERALQEKNA